jgi:hypothetical protein
MPNLKGGVHLHATTKRHARTRFERVEGGLPEQVVVYVARAGYLRVRVYVLYELPPLGDWRASFVRQSTAFRPSSLRRSIPSPSLRPTTDAIRPPTTAETRLTMATATPGFPVLAHFEI